MDSFRKPFSGTASPYRSPTPQATQGGSFKVAKCPSDALALTNLLVVSPKDFDPSTRYVSLNDQFVFTIHFDNSFPSGQIGTTLFHRRWASLSLNQEVYIQPYDPLSEGVDVYLGSLNLEVKFLRRGFEINKEFDTEEMGHVFTQSFGNQVFTRGQQLVFDFHGLNLQVQVLDLEVAELESLRSGQTQPKSGAPSNPSRGILMQQTLVQFTKAQDCTIRLKGTSRSSRANAIIQPNFKFEDMGIGGLDSEFSGIFRRAFASRIFPPSIVEKLGIQHVKGILLYGPPGTGKTLMARQIGKMLNAGEPKIVNGPEILNKYVGQSEENIRKLFTEAEQEYKAKGDESSLHIIIFDELDAICKQRGGKNDGTGVGDSVVNQLLAKMDGVEQLNNILIIGMTNRLDMIDEALLRPGRLEVHMEIGLPDEKGRFQILKIHTSKMRQNDIMGEDVDIEELAKLTKNFSGAEIAGLVKSASSFAFNRHVKVGTLAGVAPDVENMKVMRDDFLNGLEEVRPAFGISDTELQQCVQNHIIPFAPHVDRILSDGQLFVEQVKRSERTPLVSVLLHGPPGSGKTALAATIAMGSEFPFIKLISPESMVGYSENAKMTAINKTFSDSYKSPFSIIVIDNLERLLDWVPIGPRFSNSVFQTLMVLLKKRPPKDRKLLIIATASQRSILQQMDMIDAFNADIYVPNITDLSAVDIVLKELALFNEQEHGAALNALQREFQNQSVSIGIKKLLNVIEMARQDVDKVDKLVTTMAGLGL
ncbi:AAA-domain-containing protein [Basidiobolus meristosporus CBS 931.73]|uniref:Vesicular-fusion protein SEC18 n=1 Tax=Basidiobolus meristosporus CBS 931.73 TaxID=1314790 RepID=A0A1Y1XMZ1_9FUNG|nr:AAA-domain-containing protein [Basidiobolus meristosporus CBS 931.73]|eukprot:ORX86714.1 AAA-domain-containing protein [Basidiobolus meristosporus CBS 931.73]